MQNIALQILEIKEGKADLIRQMIGPSTIFRALQESSIQREKGKEGFTPLRSTQSCSNGTFNKKRFFFSRFPSCSHVDTWLQSPNTRTHTHTPQVIPPSEVMLLGKDGEVGKGWDEGVWGVRE